MDGRPEGAGADGVREWLLQLERRVDELERRAALAERRRRRGLWTLAIGVLLYLALLYGMTDLV